MKLSKQLSRREKILLVVLAVLLLFATYFFAVHRPVTRAMAQIQNESTEVQTTLEMLEIQQQRMVQMQAELDEILAQPNPTQIPAYDNLEQVMGFLNALLTPASDYSLSFEGLKQTEDSRIIRRVMNLTFTCGSYQVARDMISRMQACPYRCQLSDLSITPYADRGAGSAQRPLTSGSVTVSLKVTFFETN